MCRAGITQVLMDFGFIFSVKDFQVAYQLLAQLEEKQSAHGQITSVFLYQPVNSNELSS